MQGITIRLDVAAMSALIEADPQFKYELQRSVMSQVLRQLIMRDVKPLVEALMPTLYGELVAAIREDAACRTEMFAAVEKMFQDVKNNPTWGAKKFSLSDPIKAVLKAEVDALVAKGITDAAGTSYAVLERLKDEMIARFEAAVPGHIEDKIEAGIEQRIQAGVNARLNAIAAGIQA